MKKILLILSFIAFCSVSTFAQNVSIINGEWDRGNKMDAIKLFKVNNGQLSEIASTKINGDNKFVFAFSPEKEGYYIIAPNTNNTNRFTFYFKPGDQLNVKITPGGYELVGDANTSENKEFERWQKFTGSMESKSVYFTGKRSTYVDFFPLLEDKIEELKTYPATNTPNNIFNTSFENYKKYNLLFLAINFIQTPRTAHPKEEDYPDYYREINLADLTKDNSLLEYPGGMDLLFNTYMTTIRLNDNLSEEEKVQRMKDPAAFLLGGIDNDKIVNPQLKGEMALRFGDRNKTFAGFTEYKKKYQKYIVTDNQQKRWKEIENRLNDNAAGNDAINFMFPDMKGETVALSDFKGKVVYIDVWATWCGPCKKEIPDLKKLEEEYHSNNNMVFMSISIDSSGDKKKWEDFIVKEGLKGVQLFAGDDAKENLMSPYKIKGIPRFIIVGKDGRLILGDAPRPSSAEIRTILNDALKK